MYQINYSSLLIKCNKTYSGSILSLLLFFCWYNILIHWTVARIQSNPGLIYSSNFWVKHNSTLLMTLFLFSWQSDVHDWLIDWLAFNTVTAISQIFNSGRCTYKLKSTRSSDRWEQNYDNMFQLEPRYK